MLQSLVMRCAGIGVDQLSPTPLSEKAQRERFILHVSVFGQITTVEGNTRSMNSPHNAGSLGVKTELWFLVRDDYAVIPRPMNSPSL